MLLGAHLSIAGGIDKALKAAAKIGANCLQIFSGSPRGWETKRPTQKEIKKFKKLRRKFGISLVFVHAKYLVNIASQETKIREKSVKSLIYDLHFANRIGAAGVIFHPRFTNIVVLTESIRKVLAHSPENVWLILENSSQTGLKQIGKVFAAVENPRLRFCFDIAHAFEAGYDLTNQQGLETVFSQIQDCIGFNRWVAIHANDSKTPLGSRNDRHADIAQGKLGPLPFFVFLNHPISGKLPFIIETPAIKTEGLVGDVKNLKMLAKLSGKRLGKDFFLQPTLKVARQLLGKYLIINRNNQFQIGRIVETEAYIGPEDRASHAFRGKTPSNQIMWDEAGKLYVYLIYGMYHCLNIVTERKGYPAAVLIRAIKPVFGISGKTDGPGKLCRELGITKADNGIDISKSEEIYIKDIGEQPGEIITTPRIGVDYAGEWAKKKWRFVVVN